MRDLLLINVEGQQYGVWKDQTLSVEDGMTLHRLPLSPACIAGVCLIDDRSVTIADLPACMGYAAAGGDGKSRVLMVKESDKPVGFLVKGDILECSVAEESVLAMPECLSSEAVNACVMLDSRPVPIIDIASLYQQLTNARPGSGASPFLIPRMEKTAPEAAAIRLFRLASSLFAASANGLQQGTVEHGAIARIPSAPLFVRGVIYHDGELLPVIDLSRRLKRREVERGQAILFDAGTVRLALLVDADRGTWSVSNFHAMDLPPIVQTKWLRTAFVHAGAIIPQIDLPELFCSDAPPEKIPDRLYAPGSGFPTEFKSRDVDVLEFSLLGIKHAVPRTEVDDVVHFKPCRRIPDSPQIVIGVAEHAGKLLPVIDLATIFGRRSLITPDWNMIVLKNGDFHALIITESVFGERRLPAAIQKDVPIQLPHHVVYGCYPDGDTVRLILNVHSLAVHFEKSLVQELLATMTAEMKTATAGISASLQDEEAELPAEADAGSAEIATAGTGPVPSTGVEQADEMIQAQPGQSEQEFGLQEEQKTEPEPESKPHPQPQEETESQTVTHEPEQQPEPEEPDSSALRGQEIQHQENPQEPAVQAPVQPETLPAGEAEAPDQPAYAEQEAVEQEAEQIAAIPENEPVAPAENAGTGAGEGQKEEAEAVIRAAEDRTAEEKTAGKKEFVFFDNIDRGTSVSAADAPAEHRPGSRIDQATKRKIAYGAVAAVLAALAILLLNLDSGKSTSGQKVGNQVQPAKAEPVRTETRTAPVTAQEVPLVLDIPENRPTDIDIYTVVKGDTLWSISERFTGNPFNYPRIAGENRIADPDLIFPGQKIRLQKRK